MAETLTANYGWTKPDPGASANTWGATLNSDLDKIDAQVFSNQQAGVPIGSGAIWYAATPPANWLICDGSSLATTGTYAALFAVIGYTFGGAGANFNLPPNPGRFLLGAGGSGGVALGAVGGATTTTLTTAMMPGHAHPITDVAHTHGASQPAHVHPDPGHVHGASGSQDAHNHSVVGGNLVSTTPGGLTPGGAAMSLVGGTVDARQPNVYVSVAAAATNLQAAQPAVTVNASGTGLSTTQAVGGGSPTPIMPPFLGVNFIIKYA